MASYKVSYKILRQQGDDMKAVAKLVESYSERVAQVSGKLGEGDLLSQVRGNLGKLREQLGESRLILNTAGEFLVKTVDSYTGVEVRQVKQADSTRAHNRDFYKNPVVVASVGGAAAGAGAAAAMPAATTVNYTDNSVMVNNYVSVESAPASAAVQDAAPAAVSTTAAPARSNIAATPAPAPSSAPQASSGAAGIAAGAGLAGGVLGAGAVMGGKHIFDKNKKSDSEASDRTKSKAEAESDYDPEAELERAMARVRELEDEEV